MEDKAFDMAIIGCGPAGLSAALNAQVRKKKFILLGTEFCSPKMHISPWVDNYLGEFHVPGFKLREKFLNHIKESGIEIVEKRVDAVYPIDGEYVLQWGNNQIKSKTVIIATGVEYGKRLEGEDDYVGKGVSYCATCDGPLFQDKRVAMLVYSRDAFDEIKFLSGICEQVIMFPLFPGELPELPPNVIINRGIPLKIMGNGSVNRIVTDQETISLEGIFLFREAVPPSRLITGLESVEGAVKVNKNMETNLPGLFAAGDCTGKPFQLAKAVGEGQVAALNAVHYLDNR